VPTVWKIELDDPLLAAPQRRAWLDDMELRRFASFTRADDARSYAAAHTALREILATMLGCAPIDITFHRDPFGRPRAGSGALDFSMTHAGNLCLVAISQVHRVGVDLERLRQPIEPGFLDLIAAPAEKVRIKAELDGHDATLSLWVAKEAVLKADGAGLTRDPRGVVIDWDTRGPSGVALDGLSSTLWNLTRLDIGPEWVAVLATTARLRTLNNVLHTYRPKLH
jgi:4'-phosphopantetheinyl transferase